MSAATTAVLRPKPATAPDSNAAWATRAAAVAAGALLTLWPALYNRYPLLYPDSMTYLADGSPVARALFLHQLSDYYGMRSLLYSLGILPLHWNVTLWPVAALHALLTAYVIWLVVRSLRPRGTVLPYLVLMLALSALSSMSWSASLILPDILGPILYLCTYLLVYARDTLSAREHVAVGVIAWWAITSHATHLPMALALCLLLSALAMWRQQPRGARLRAVMEVAGIALLAAVAQLALHGYLYGEPSLNGERPPFLMARVIADGPGRWYLQQHCPEAKLAICAWADRLPDNTDDILWSDGGIWQSADPDTATRLLAEETPFVLATLRTYPRQQLSHSAANFWEQLHTIGLWDLDASDWVLAEFDSTLPRARASYLHGRQSQNELPLEFFSAVQQWTVVASLLAIVACLPFLLRRPRRAVGLTVIVIFAVLANAFLTGTMSAIEPRYGARVIWLLPMLAGTLMIVRRWPQRGAE